MAFLSARLYAFGRCISGAVALLALAALAAGGPASAADVIAVTVDQARVVQLPEQTATIILGNPIIADVTLLKKSGAMVLTGKSFGETNLIALDSRGNAVGESIIRVSGSGSTLIVQRGMDRASYTCAPRCQPTINLGDDSKYIQDITGQVQSRNALAVTR